MRLRSPLIREILYADAPEPHTLKDKHPYLRSFLNIVLKSPLTVTYNFDGYLEMMLAASETTVDERGRPYEVVFDGSKPFRSSTGVIYHPNGYLPQNALERASDDLVLSEEQFGDQLLAASSSGCR
jgi:SIR2-like domain